MAIIDILAPRIRGRPVPSESAA